MTSTADKLVDKLPYADGSGRRRFIAGSIILAGFTLFYWSEVQSSLVGISFLDILRNPIVIGGIIVIIYALGNIIEILSDYFLLRIVGGIYQAFNDYSIQRNRAKNFLQRIAAPLFLPVRIGLGIGAGVSGNSTYHVDLFASLSRKAWVNYKGFPSRVRRGFRYPIGNETDLSVKYVLNHMQNEEDKKWARKLINRSKEVAVLTTSLFFLIAYATYSGFINIYSNDTENIWKSDLRELRRAIDNSMATTLVYPVGFDTEIDYYLAKDDTLARLLSKQFNPIGSLPESYSELTIGRTPDHISEELLISHLQFYNSNVTPFWFRELEERVELLRSNVSDGDPTTPENSFAAKMDSISTRIAKLEISHQEYSANETIYSQLLEIITKTLTLLVPLIVLYLGFFRSLIVAHRTILEFIAI